MRFRPCYNKPNLPTIGGWLSPLPPDESRLQSFLASRFLELRELETSNRIAGRMDPIEMTAQYVPLHGSKAETLAIG